MKSAIKTKFEFSDVPFAGDDHFSHFNTDLYVTNLKFHKKIFFKFSYEKKSIFISLVCTAEGIWSSLPSATFGGFETSNGENSSKFLIQFIEAIEIFLKNSHQAIKIVIHIPPAASGYFAPEVQFYVLYSRGYSIQTCNLSYSMKILPIEFEALISYGNLKRIRKCNKLDVVAQENTLDMLQKIYEIISENRRSKGFPMTLSFKDLEDQAKLFPNKIKLFSIELDGQLIAGAITVQINSSTLYVLYWGDLIEFRSFSPIVLLCKKIYDFCVKNGINYMDVGTSTIDKEPNFGLMDFKADLGFSPNLKFTLVKEL